MGVIVFIEAEQGRITSDISFAAFVGASVQNENYEIKITSIQGLSIELALQKYKQETVLPVGSVDFVKKAAEILGVNLPGPLNIPPVLIPYLGRNVWAQRKSEVEKFPCFVKPLDDVKRFTGFVVKSKVDFDAYPELKDWDGMLFCSDLIIGIAAEWRCYVLNGSVTNCSCYRGDSLAFPDRNTILGLIEKNENAPVAYSLDVAVTTQGTVLIECNDAWALGYYGGEFEDYFRMVKDRWLEILEQ